MPGSTQTLSELSELALRSLVILAGTATLIGASASRHNDLSNRMRSLTVEYRGSTQEKRRESLRKQIAVFKFRAKASAWGHISLYFAFVVEVIFFALAFGPWQNLNFGLVTVPLSLIVIGVGCHLLEHSRAFTTLNEETADVLTDSANDSTKSKVAGEPLDNSSAAKTQIAGSSDGS